MRGPSQDLINRCYTVLAQCEQFMSLDNLRAVFISDELHPFRDRLRDASNIDERIRLNVDYLLYQMTTDGRHVFPLFLQALLPPYEGEVLYDKLNRLRVEFEQALDEADRIIIPYIVAAMTQMEAVSLQEGTIFQDRGSAPVEQERFEAIEPALSESWVKDYGDRRDGWKLHADHQSVIGMILEAVFADINGYLRQPENLPAIVGQSLSEEFFSPEQQGETWEYLRQSGGFLIVDAVSLFYPPIRKALASSALVGTEETAVLILSPLDFHALPTNNSISELVEDELTPIFTRFAKNLDHRYEIGSGDLYGIQRWLFKLFSRPEDMATIIRERRKKPQLRRMNKLASTGRISSRIFRQGREEGRQ